MQDKRTLSKEEWIDLENNLRWPLAQREILCDEYKVTLQVQNLKKLRLGIFVFVDGHMKGKWQLEDCEERRRFFRPVKYPLYPDKKLQKIEKDLARLQHRPSRHRETGTCYFPWWTDFTAMRRHLERNNEDIQLVVEAL